MLLGGPPLAVPSRAIDLVAVVQSPPGGDLLFGRRRGLGDGGHASSFFPARSRAPPSTAIPARPFGPRPSCIMDRLRVREVPGGAAQECAYTVPQSPPQVSDVSDAQPSTATAAIVRSVSPEEREYERRLRLIAARKRRLSEHEAELAVLKGALERFEAVCRSRVGDLLVELRRIDRAAADYQGRIDRLRHPTPTPPEPEPPDEPDPEPEPFPPDEHDPTTGAAVPPDWAGRRTTGPERGGEAEVKRLYLELAKRCHPDLARDVAERDRRAALMQRVNDAFRDRDLVGLQAIQRETEADDPGFGSRPLRDRLAWAGAELSRLDALLAGVKAEFARLRGYEMHRLWRRHEAGEPVLDELEDELEARLVAKGRRLDRLIAAYLQARQDRPRRSRIAS